MDDKGNCVTVLHALPKIDKKLFQTRLTCKFFWQTFCQIGPFRHFIVRHFIVRHFRQNCEAVK
jgi:hypothetical protein